MQLFCTIISLNMKDSNVTFKCWEQLSSEKRAYCFESDKGKRIPLLAKKGGPNHVIGRTIIDANPYLGSYGMGGPGFFGMKLEKKGRFREEWLVITMWGADQWLLFDGKWLDCHSDRFDSAKCIFPNYEGYFHKVMERVKMLFLGLTISDLKIRKKSFKMTLIKLGNIHFLELPNDLSKLPKYGNNTDREWYPNDKMETAFLISPTQYINI